MLMRGETTPTALLGDAIDRIDRANAALGAFVHVDRLGATRAALEAERRQSAGRRIGPLDGVPVSIKDNLWVRDIPARWGSRMWADFVPVQDDLPIEKLKAAGAVIVGKTNTPEFALSARTDSPLHGPSRNPWDTTLTPGGSSGGAVASVASGMVPIGICTDAGGSTRLPASYTGLYGLRPSNGRIPRRYGFAPMALDFQVIGIVARTLEDLRMSYEVLKAPDHRDPTSIWIPEERPAQGRRLRIGWFNRHGSELVDPEVAAAVHECAAALAGADCEIVPRKAFYDVGVVRRIWSTIHTAGIARAVGNHPDRWRREATAPIAAAAERGLRMGAVEYVRALDDLANVRADIAEGWGDVDAYLCPSAASPAWPLEGEHPAFVAGEPGHPAVQGTFATWVNAVGHPGLSVPARPHADGRPLGVQIVGRYGGDETVLEVARRLESVATWERPPFPAW